MAEKDKAQDSATLPVDLQGVADSYARYATGAPPGAGWTREATGYQPGGYQAWDAIGAGINQAVEAARPYGASLARDFGPFVDQPTPYGMRGNNAVGFAPPPDSMAAPRAGWTREATGYQPGGYQAWDAIGAGVSNAVEAVRPYGTSLARDFGPFVDQPTPYGMRGNNAFGYSAPAAPGLSADVSGTLGDWHTRAVQGAAAIPGVLQQIGPVLRDQFLYNGKPPQPQNPQMHGHSVPYGGTDDGSTGGVLDAYGPTGLRVGAQSPVTSPTGLGDAAMNYAPPPGFAPDGRPIPAPMRDTNNYMEASGVRTGASDIPPEYKNPAFNSYDSKSVIEGLRAEKRLDVIKQAMASGYGYDQARQLADQRVYGTPPPATPAKTGFGAGTATGVPEKALRLDSPEVKDMLQSLRWSRDPAEKAAIANMLNSAIGASYKQDGSSDELAAQKLINDSLYRQASMAADDRRHQDNYGLQAAAASQRALEADRTAQYRSAQAALDSARFQATQANSDRQFEADETHRAAQRRQADATARRQAGKDRAELDRDPRLEQQKQREYALKYYEATGKWPSFRDLGTAPNNGAVGHN
jgi:hypothetical protein